MKFTDHEDLVRQARLRLRLAGTSDCATAEFLTHAAEDVGDLADALEELVEDAEEATGDLEVERDEAVADLATARRVFEAMRASPDMRVAVLDECVDIDALVLTVYALPLFDLLAEVHTEAVEEAKRQTRAATQREEHAQNLTRRFNLSALRRICGMQGILVSGCEMKLELARKIAASRK